MTEPKKRRWVLFLVAAAVLAAAGLAAVRFLVVWPEPPGTEYTEASFRDNAERLMFARSLLPFEVPDETQVEKLHYVSWLDESFECTLRMPEETMPKLREDFAQNWEGGNDRYQLDNPDYSYEVTIPPDGTTLWLKALSGSGPHPQGNRP